MIKSSDLLDTAKRLLGGSPTQTDLRRSISAAYYAVFHHVCSHFSTIVFQPTDVPHLNSWLLAYRYLDHGPAKQRCQDVALNTRSFPDGIVKFSVAFVELQQRRIDADYDPSLSFAPADAYSLIDRAQKAIDAFNAEPLEVQRAFVVFIGLRAKNR